MCEPLRGKRVSRNFRGEKYYCNSGLEFKFDDVKSAVDFYKANYTKPSKEIWGKFIIEYPDVGDRDKWLDWLFTYCFGDVIE